jgi:hypothetical protein
LSTGTAQESSEQHSLCFGTVPGSRMLGSERIRHDAFRKAHETIAVWEILYHPVTNAERSVLEPDAWSTLHQRALELVAADHLVQHQQMPRIDNVLVVLQPITVFDKSDGILAP